MTLDQRDRHRSRRAPMRFAFAVVCVATISVACSSPKNSQGIDQINSPTTIAVKKSSSTSALQAITTCKVAGCESVAAAVAAGAQVKALPADVRPALAVAANDGELPPGLGASCVQAGRTKSPACLVPGSSSSAPKLALFGDSQADIWSGTMAAIAGRAGYGFLLMAEDNCHSPMITFWDETTKVPNHVCDEWRTDAISRINSFEPQVLLVATQDVESFDGNDKLISQSQYAAGLKATLEKLSAPNRTIIVIGNAPYAANFGPACLAANDSDVQKCSDPAAQAVFVANDTAIEHAAAASGAKYVNVVPWFCTATVCPQVISDTVVYRDPGHFTATYARELKGVMTAALGLQ